eukprot:GEMP01000010.1.p1 GENE.GEMP01000010.1~~GEMP01000010.1.p1  ORF type:complete len:5409 (-),score=949.82 GEMP01000010.1:210-16436(-)
MFWARHGRAETSVSVMCVLMAAIFLGSWQCALGQEDTCEDTTETHIWAFANETDSASQDDDSNLSNKTLHQFLHMGCFRWTAGTQAAEDQIKASLSANQRVRNPHECASNCTDADFFMLVAGVCTCVQEDSLEQWLFTALYPSVADLLCTEPCEWDDSLFPGLAGNWSQTGFCGGGSDLIYLSLYQRYAPYVVMQDMVDKRRNIHWKVVQVETYFGKERDSICIATDCIQPDLDSLYIDVVEETLAHESFNAILLCMTGYSGNVTANKCPIAGTPYTVAGACTSDDCTPPALDALQIDFVVGTLTYESFIAILHCKTGYSGSVTANKCPSRGTPYTVSGSCTPDDCTPPDLGALHIDLVEETLTYESFDVTLSCKTRYSGSVTANKCASPGTPYTVNGGCTAYDCTQPDLSDQQIDVQTETLTYESFAATLQCKSGYLGSVTAIRCAIPDTKYTFHGACAPDNIEYIGCYKDNETRAMSYAPVSGSTSQACNLVCGALGVNGIYFGLQSGGTQCFCSANTNYAQYGAGSSCGPACAGENQPSRPCGWVWTNAVYRTFVATCIPSTIFVISNSCKCPDTGAICAAGKFCYEVTENALETCNISALPCTPSTTDAIAIISCKCGDAEATCVSGKFCYKTTGGAVVESCVNSAAICTPSTTDAIAIISCKCGDAEATCVSGKFCYKTTVGASDETCESSPVTCTPSFTDVISIPCECGTAKAICKPDTFCYKPTGNAADETCMLSAGMDFICQSYWMAPDGISWTSLPDSTVVDEVECIGLCWTAPDCKLVTYDDDAKKCYRKTVQENYLPPHIHCDNNASGKTYFRIFPGLSCRVKFRTREYFLHAQSLDFDAAAFPMQVYVNSPSINIWQQLGVGLPEDIRLVEVFAMSESKLLPHGVLRHNPRTISQANPVPRNYTCDAGYDCVIQLNGYAFAKTNFVTLIRKGEPCALATPTVDLDIAWNSTTDVSTDGWLKPWNRGIYSFGVSPVGIHLTICFGDRPTKGDSLELAGNLVIRGPIYVANSSTNYLASDIFNDSQAEYDILEAEFHDYAMDFNATTVRSICFMGADHCFITYLSMDPQPTDRVVLVVNGTCGSEAVEMVTATGIINPSAPIFADGHPYRVVHDFGKITMPNDGSCKLFGHDLACPAAIPSNDYELCWGAKWWDADLRSYPISLGKFSLYGPFPGQEFLCHLESECVIGPIGGIGINEIGEHIVILKGGHTCGDPSSQLGIIAGFSNTPVEKNIDTDEYYLGTATDSVYDSSRWSVCWTRRLRERRDDQNNITHPFYVPDFAILVGELVFLPALDKIVEVQSSITFEVPDGAWDEEDLRSFFQNYIMQSTGAGVNNLELIDAAPRAQRRRASAVTSESFPLTPHLDDRASPNRGGDASSSFTSTPSDTPAQTRRLSQSFSFDLIINNANGDAVNALTSINSSRLQSSMGDSLKVDNTSITSTTKPATTKDVILMVSGKRYALPPTNVKAVARTTASIFFSWVFRVDKRGDCEHNAWRIQARSTKDGLWFVPVGCSQVVDPKTRSCLAGNLVSNTKYEFRVMITCDDWITNSPFSVVTDGVLTLPFRAQAPQNVEFSSAPIGTFSNFSLSWAVIGTWEPGSDSGDCEFVSWDVQVLLVGISEWHDAPGCEILLERDNATCRALVTQSEQDYAFRVRETCGNAQASSTWAETASTVTTGFSNNSITAARAPQISVSDLTSRTLVVSWVPGDANDCVFTHWRVQARVVPIADDGKDTDDDVLTWFSPGGCKEGGLHTRTMVRCTAVDLRSSTPYEFRIREECVNVAANSLFAITSATRTLIHVASPLASMVAANPTQHTIDLRWTPGNMGDCEFARWDVEIWNGRGWMSTTICGRNMRYFWRTSCTATNLKSQSAYKFRARAICVIAFAIGEWATTDVTRTLPIAAATPPRLVVGNSEVKLAEQYFASRVLWASRSLGDCDFSHWAVERKPASGSWEQAVGCTGLSMYVYATTTCEAVELACNMEYEFRVRVQCVNVDASSPWRVALAPLVTTDAGFCISTMRPPLLILLAIFERITAHAITIVWDRPHDDMRDCKAFKSWVVQICQGASAECMMWNTPAGCDSISRQHNTRNQCTATNLLSSTPYAIRVAGECLVTSLSSSFAVSDEITTKSVPAGPPTLLQLRQDTPYTLRASWEPPSLNDCYFSSYVMELRRNEDVKWIAHPLGCDRLHISCTAECELQNLRSNTIYTFRMQVLCVDPDTKSPLSITATNITLPRRALPPERLMNHPPMADHTYEYPLFSALLYWNASLDFDCQFSHWRVSRMARYGYLYEPYEESTFIRVRSSEDNNVDGLCDGNGVNGKTSIEPNRQACEETCKKLNGAVNPCTGISYGPSIKRCVLYQGADIFTIPTSVQPNGAGSTSVVADDVRCYARTGCDRLTRRETPSCLATGLRCDSTYFLRVEAVCSDPLANSIPSTAIIIRTGRGSTCIRAAEPPVELSLHAYTSSNTDASLEFSWAPGSWNECTFKRWDVQIANAEEQNRMWSAPLGIATEKDYAMTKLTCAAVSMDPATAMTDTIKCVALQLATGTSYVMRVRTICRDAAANSRWVQSEVFSTCASDKTVWRFQFTKVSSSQLESLLVFNSTWCDNEPLRVTQLTKTISSVTITLYEPAAVTCIKWVLYRSSGDSAVRMSRRRQRNLRVRRKIMIHETARTGAAPASARALAVTMDDAAAMSLYDFEMQYESGCVMVPSYKFFGIKQTQTHIARPFFTVFDIRIKRGEALAVTLESPWMHVGDRALVVRNDCGKLSTVPHFPLGGKSEGATSIRGATIGEHGGDDDGWPPTLKSFSWGQETTAKVEPGVYQIKWCDSRASDCSSLVPPFSQYVLHVANLAVEGSFSHQWFSRYVDLSSPLVVGPVTYPEAYAEQVVHYGTRGDRLFVAPNITCQHVPRDVNPILGPLSLGTLDGFSFTWPSGAFTNTILTNFTLCFFPFTWQRNDTLDWRDMLSSLHADSTRVVANIGTLSLMPCRLILEVARSTPLGTLCKCAAGYFRDFREGGSLQCEKCPVGNFCPEREGEYESVAPVKCPLSESTDELSPLPKVKASNCVCAAGNYRLYISPFTPRLFRRTTGAFEPSLDITFFVSPPSAATDIEYIKLLKSDAPLAMKDAPFAESDNCTLTATLPDSMLHSIEGMVVHIFGLPTWAYISAQIDGIHLGYFVVDAARSVTALRTSALTIRTFLNNAPNIVHGLQKPCYPCTRGELKSNVGDLPCSGACELKLPHTTSDEGGRDVRDCYCSRFHYLNRAAGDMGVGKCEVCAMYSAKFAGVTCVGGLDDKNQPIMPMSNPGFYLVHPYSDEMVECPAKAGCYGNNTCAEGMIGHACGQCAYGFTRSTNADICSRCPKDTVRNVLSIGIMGIVYLAVVTVVSAMALRSANSEKNLNSVVMKIYINYLFCIGALSNFSMLHVKWPLWAENVWSGALFTRDGTPSVDSSFDCLLRSLLAEYFHWDVDDLQDTSALMRYAFWIVVPILVLLIQMWSGVLILKFMNYRTLKMGALDTVDLAQLGKETKYVKWNRHTLLRRDHKEYDVPLHQWAQKRCEEMEAASSFLPQGDEAIPPMEPTESLLEYVVTHLCHAHDIQGDVDDVRSVLRAPTEHLFMLDAYLFELHVLTESIQMLRDACQTFLRTIHHIHARKRAKSTIGFVGERVQKLMKISERALCTEVNVILDLPRTLYTTCTNFGADSIGLLSSVKMQLRVRRGSIASRERDESVATYIMDVLDGAIYFGNSLVSDVCSAMQARDVLNHAGALRAEWIDLVAPKADHALKELGNVVAIINHLKNCEDEVIQDELVHKLLSFCDARFGALSNAADAVATWSKTHVKPFVRRIVERITWSNCVLLEAFVKCVTVDLFSRRPIAHTARREKELDVRAYLLRTCACIWRTKMDVDPEVLLEVLSSVPNETLTELYPKEGGVNPAALAAKVLEICQVERPTVWALAHIKPRASRILLGEVDLDTLFRAIDYVDERKLVLQCALLKKPVRAEARTWAATVAITLLRAVIGHGAAGGFTAWGKALIRPKIRLYCVNVLHVDCDVVLRALDYVAPEKVYDMVQQVEHTQGILEVTNALIRILKQSSPRTWALVYLQPLTANNSILAPKKQDMDIGIVISRAVPSMPLSALSELVLLQTQNLSRCRNELEALSRQHFPKVYTQAVLKQKLSECCFLRQVHCHTLFNSITLPCAQVLTVLLEREQSSTSVSKYDTDTSALKSLLQLAKVVNPAKYFEALWRIPLREFFDALQLDEKAFYGGLRTIPLECLEQLDVSVREDKVPAFGDMLRALHKHCPKEWARCKLKGALGPMFSKEVIGELDLRVLDKVVQLAMQGDWRRAKEVALRELRKANVALWARVVMEERCQQFWSIPTVFTPCFMREISVSNLCHAVTMALDSNDWAQAAAFLYQRYQDITSRSNALFAGEYRIGCLEIPRRADMSFTSFLLHANKSPLDVRSSQCFNSMKRHLQWFTADECRDVFFQAHSDDAMEDIRYLVDIFKLKAIEKDKYLIVAKKPDGQEGDNYYIGAMAEGGMKMTPHLKNAQVFTIQTSSGTRQFPHCICGQKLMKTRQKMSVDCCMFCTQDITASNKGCFSCADCYMNACNRCAPKHDRRARTNAFEHALFEKEDCILVRIDANEQEKDSDHDDEDDDDAATQNNTVDSNNRMHILYHRSNGRLSLHKLLSDTTATATFCPKARADSYLTLEPVSYRALGVWSYFHADFPQKKLWAKRHYVLDVKMCLPIISFFLHTNITKSMLALIECNTMLSQTRYIGTAAPLSRLMSNPDIICWEGKHQLWAIVSITGLVCWTFGMPFLAFVCLKKKRTQLFSSLKMRRQFGFLYNGFEPQYYYWEMVILLRKVLVSIIATWNFGGDSLRLPLYMLLAAVSLTSHLSILPYDNRGMYLLDRMEAKVLSCWLATVSLLILVIMFNFNAVANIIFAFILFGIQLCLFLHVLDEWVHQTARQVRGTLSVSLGTREDGRRGHLWHARCSTNVLAPTPTPQTQEKDEPTHASITTSSFTKDIVPRLQRKVLHLMLTLTPMKNEMHLYYRPFPYDKMGLVVICPSGTVNVSRKQQRTLNHIFAHILATSMVKLPVLDELHAPSSRSRKAFFVATWTFYDYFLRQIVFSVRREIVYKDLTYQRLGNVEELLEPLLFIRNSAQGVDVRSLIRHCDDNHVCINSPFHDGKREIVSPESVFFTMSINDFYLAYKMVDRLITDLKMWELQSDLDAFARETDKLRALCFLQSPHEKRNDELTMQRAFQNALQTVKTLPRVPTQRSKTSLEERGPRSEQYHHKVDIAHLSPVARSQHATLAPPVPAEAPPAEVRVEVFPDHSRHAVLNARQNARIGTAAPRLSLSGKNVSESTRHRMDIMDALIAKKRAQLVVASREKK